MKNTKNRLGVKKKSNADDKSKLKGNGSQITDRNFGRTVDRRAKNFLTESEIKRLLDAAKRGRHGVRAYAMLLVMYRHGLRVSELIDLRTKEVDLDAARLFVRRLKGSLSTEQPVAGDELRAVRAWLRERGERADARSPYLFLSERGALTRFAINYLVEKAGKRAKFDFGVHPHMLRHSCG